MSRGSYFASGLFNGLSSVAIFRLPDIALARPLDLHVHSFIILLLMVAAAGVPLSLPCRNKDMLFPSVSAWPW